MDDSEKKDFEKNSKPNEKHPSLNRLRKEVAETIASALIALWKLGKRVEPNELASTLKVVVSQKKKNKLRRNKNEAQE